MRMLYGHWFFLFRCFVFSFIHVLSVLQPAPALCLRCVQAVRLHSVSPFSLACTPVQRPLLPRSGASLHLSAAGCKLLASALLLLLLLLLLPPSRCLTDTSERRCYSHDNSSSKQQQRPLIPLTTQQTSWRSDDGRTMQAAHRRTAQRGPVQRAPSAEQAADSHVDCRSFKDRRQMTVGGCSSDAPSR